MQSCIDFICSIFVQLLSLIFRFIPTGFVLWLGRRFGILAYHVNINRKIIGYANLRAAFCREKTPRELKKLIKGVYKNLVETFFEIISLVKVNEKYIDKYVDIINLENMLKIYDYPKGIILLTAHFGNWELSGMTSAMKGIPLVALAREQKMKRMNELINRLRESKGLTVVRKGATTKNLLKALHEGKTVGMVADQDAGKTGVFTEFFGRPVSTAPGAARIAAKTGAYILPGFMARTKGPYHKLIVEKPVKIKRDENITPYLAKYNKLLEKYIRMYPEQWLWLHKRWKSTPLKKVVVLSDGKTGHLNQALGIFKKLKKYRENSGYNSSETEMQIVEIRFKNRFTKMLLSLSSLFATSACQGCMRCLRFYLTKDSYRDLMSKYADITISCGSGTAGVNRLFAIENNAKSAVIMKPSILSLKKFNMVVLPRHDVKGREQDNVISTDIVPNIIDEEYLEESSKNISKLARLKKSKGIGPSTSLRTDYEHHIRIGVLLGGDNPDFALTEDVTEELLSNVINAANRLDADILFTTSRRTPKKAEKIVKDKLRPERRCKFLVIANENNTPYAVGGILGLSDIVIVSCESASMVSEAVSSGKTVIVFKLKKKKKSSKFERMLSNLENKDYITVAEADEVSDAVYRAFRNARLTKRIPKRDDVYMHMWRLL